MKSLPRKGQAKTINGKPAEKEEVMTDNPEEEPKGQWKAASEGVGCFFLALAVLVLVYTYKLYGG